MRINVKLAPDAREFAELYAYANGLTLGQAITELVRKAQKASSIKSNGIEFVRGPSGFPVLPRSGRTITTEIVKAALEDDVF